MAWPDDFIKGSFRGVPFNIERSEVKGGRRKQDREFAKRGEGNSEDLGKRLKSFTMELYVLGDDYFQQRIALEDALEAEGPGELVHPYRGTLQVQAGEYSLVETRLEGRIARFTVNFTKAGELKFPSEVNDAVKNAGDDATSMIDNSKSFFETVFTVLNQPAFVVDSAADTINSVTEFAEDAVAQVTNPVTDFAFAMRNIRTSVNDLIRLPGELAGRLQDAFQLLLDEFSDDPETSQKIFGNMTNVNDQEFFGTVAGNTPSRQREQTNRDAAKNLMRQLVLGNRVTAAIEIEYTSSDEAIETRDAIIEELDEELFLIEDDDLFQSVKELQASLSEALPVVGQSELVTFTPKVSLPVLVLAHDVFEDLDKEQEIIDENEIEHPGFAPGGTELRASAD